MDEMDEKTESDTPEEKRRMVDKYLPTSATSLPQTDCVLATLTPLNLLAKQSFASVAAVIDEARFSHARKFVSVADKRYIIPLYPLPLAEESGWVAGTDPAKADLVLSLSPLPDGSIGSNHLQISFKPTSRALCLRVVLGREVVLGGNMLITGSLPHLLTAGVGIQVGALTYTFDYGPILSTDQSPQVLEAYWLRRKWSFHSAPASLSATPNVESVLYQRKFHIQNRAVVKGTFGAVSFGWHYQGAPVAVKRIDVGKSDHDMLINEIALLKSITHVHTSVFLA